MSGISTGDGWAAGTMDDMGEGPGFRKVRKELGVTAFGVNAVVVPPGYASGRHLHERQEELYFVHRGTVEFILGDDTVSLGPGGFVRVDPSTVRSVRNPSETEDAVYVAIGGAGGYVGRDGMLPQGESNPR
jgi:mannose-6-phosphate isomerase-like protein (cupin superfamily)